MLITKRVLPWLFMPLLSGCGLFVPNSHELYEPGNSDAIFLNTILNNIKCEIRNGAYDTVKYLEGNPEAAWLSTWGAKIDLKFTADETGELNPGVLLTPPSPFSFGLDLGSSAHATKVEDVGFTYAFADLLKEYDDKHPPKPCTEENGILIQSDLNIKDFIFKNVFITTVPDTTPDLTKTFYDTLQYTITFVASYSASATPTWTFKHSKINGFGDLLKASRMKTSNLLITFSQAIPAKQDKPARLSDQGLAAHTAALTGQATGTANQSVQP